MNDNEELNSVEDIVGKPTVDYAATKRRVVMLLLAYSAILGITLGFGLLPGKDKLIDFVVFLPFTLLGIFWCSTDAAERDHRIGRPTGCLLILLFCVGLPIYLFQTRGVVAIRTLSLTMVLVVAMFACLIVTSLATLYFGEVTGLWKIDY